MVLLGIAVASLGGGGCEQKSEAPAPSASAPVVRAPERAPEGTLLEVVVPNPRAAWRFARDLTHGSRGPLPNSFELALGTELGLGATDSTTIDPDRPLTLALEPGPEKASWVLGVPLREPLGLLASLSRGRDARYRAEKKQGMTLLHAAGQKYALGLVGSYLIAAPQSEAVLRHGPNLALRLPSRAKEVESALVWGGASQTMVRSTWVAWLERAWQAESGELRASAQDARSENGRAADFANPDAALGLLDRGVQVLVGHLTRSKGATIQLVPRPFGVEVEVRLRREVTTAARLTPDTKDPGPSRLAQIGPDVWLGAFLRSPTADRLAMAADATAFASDLFGERLEAKDREAIGEALTSLATGRGDELFVRWSQAGLSLSGTTQDAQALRKGFERSAELLDVSAVRAPLESWIGKFSLRRPRPGPEGATRIELSRQQGSPIQGSWQVQKDGWSAWWGTGKEPEPFLDDEASRDPALLSLLHGLSDADVVLVGRPFTWRERSDQGSGAAVLALRSSPAEVEVALRTRPEVLSGLFRLPKMR